MDRETLVYVDLDGKPHHVERLWSRVRENKESASFEYDNAWPDNPLRFSLEPALQVGAGAFHTPPDTAMFGATGDPHPIAGGELSCAEPSAGALSKPVLHRVRYIGILVVHPPSGQRRIPTR